MAAPPAAKSAKRISSFFNISKDDPVASDGAPTMTMMSTPSFAPPPPPPPHDFERSGYGPIMRKPVSVQNLSTFDIPPERPQFFSPPPIDSPYDPTLLPPPSLAQSDRGRSDSPTGRRPDSRDERRSKSRPNEPLLVIPGKGSRDNSRPSTPVDGKSRRRSLFGKGAQTVNDAPANVGRDSLKAWIAGLQETIPYELSPLLTARHVSELWDDDGDLYVYLFPQGTNKGPSFKTSSEFIADSKNLHYLFRTASQQKANPRRDRRSLDLRSVEDSMRRTSLNVPMSPGMSHRVRASSDAGSSISGQSGRLGSPVDEEQSPDRHLYLPIPFEGDVSTDPPTLRGNDIEMLVLYRNLFAFLIGHALVSTQRHPSTFSIFMGISNLLQRFEFSNLDGSNFGEIASTTFDHYCDELQLYDLRRSREKTIEAIVLGEQMKSWKLFNEGFVHGAGKLEEIKGINSPKFMSISTQTRNKLERARLDLDGRLQTIGTRLEDFDFPSMFSGIASSSVSNEGKDVRYKAWKAAFVNLRKHILTYYKNLYGAWPPKAKSKKNNFKENGLNRLVLMDLYRNLSDLYDLLVDRTSITTRSTDMHSQDDLGDRNDPEDTTVRALRRIMSEYDRSTPPVKPPIPFDTPRLPSLLSVRPNYDPRRDAKERTKRLKDNEIHQILLDAYNRDSTKSDPFLEEFGRYEHKEAHGKSIDEISDSRVGQWLFMYAVLQSLPMVVVEAPDVQFTRGVEYFLCEPPRGGLPWAREDSSRARTYYEVAGGAGGVIALPSDHVAHSVEGIYHRSHCWEVASLWAPNVGSTSTLPQVPELPVAAPAHRLSRHISPHQSPYQSPHISPGLIPVDPANDLEHRRRRSSMQLGLDALPLPAGMTPDGRKPRPVSQYDPSKTFDSILAGVEQKPGKKK